AFAIQWNLDQLRELFIVLVRLNARRQHHRIGDDGERHAERLVEDGDLESVAIRRYFRLAIFLVADECDAELPRPGVILFLETVGTDVAVEDVHMRVRRQFFYLQRIFDRLGAAHARAIGPFFVSRTDALDHYHRFLLTIRFQEGIVSNETLF